MEAGELIGRVNTCIFETLDHLNSGQAFYYQRSIICDWCEGASERSGVAFLASHRIARIVGSSN